MARPRVRNLTFISIGLVILGIILFFAGAAGSTFTTTVDSTGNTVPTSASIGNPALVIFGVLLLIGGAIVHLVAYVGALIKTAQLQQWVWFVVILLLGTIPLLIYIFAGPDTPPAPAYPGYPQGYVPPQGGYGQPGQPYPPQYPPYPQQPPYQPPPQQQ